jgi:hypothetical protein
MRPTQSGRVVVLFARGMPDIPIRIRIQRLFWGDFYHSQYDMTQWGGNWHRRIDSLPGQCAHFRVPSPPCSAMHRSTTKASTYLGSQQRFFLCPPSHQG